MIDLEMPWPPSVNTYWRHPTRGPLAGRHLISVEGRKYREEIKRRFYGLDHKLTGRLAVKIEAYPPDRRTRDLDNILKSLLDALVHAGVIDDDGHIDSLSIERCDVVPGGRISISAWRKN